ncbi:MAG: hypothetical protein R3C17_20395 [Planctomycetaceae bacterium]
MTARIQIPCSQCGAMLGAPAEAAGKQVRCPKCKTAVSVPHSAAPAPRSGRGSGDNKNVQPPPRRNTQAPPSRKSPPASREQRRPESTTRPGSANSSGRKVKPRQPVEDNLFDDLDELEYIDEPAGYDEHYGTAGLPPRKKSAAARTRRYESTANASTASASSDNATGGSKKILGGILTMVGAVVWFVVGLFVFDVIFFYPPIMFVLGFIAFVKGIFSR